MRNQLRLKLKEHRSFTGDELLDALYDSNPMRLITYRHKKDSSDFSLWHFKSSGLRNAVDTIGKDIFRRIRIGRKKGKATEITIAAEMYPICLMLMGLWLETYLKGALVLIHGAWDKTFEGHKLSKLSKLLKMQLSPEDEKHLDLLADHIYWMGKYPVPRTPKDYKDSLREWNWIGFDWMQKEGINSLLNVKSFVDGFERRIDKHISETLKARKSKKVITGYY